MNASPPLERVHAALAGKRAWLVFMGLAAYIWGCGLAHAAPPNCSATSTTVNFGSYLPTNAAALGSTGVITLTCNRNGSYSIALSTGQSGSFNPRYMSGGSPVNQLDYNLYIDAAHTILWGDGTAGTSVATGTYSKNASVTITVYGLLPAAQNVGPGAYTDSITATITY